MTALPLPPKLDLSQVGLLTTALRDRAGSDVVLDAGEVSHLGGLGLQVLLSAAQSWRSSGHSLSIQPRSEAFDEALTLFGVGLDAVQSQEAA